MSGQEIKSGDNSVNTQNYGHTIQITGSGSVKVAGDGKDKLDFIKELIGIITAAILAVTSFLTNPTAEEHRQKIARGPFKNYTLDRELFYDNNIFYSEMYTIGKDNKKLYFLEVIWA